MAIESKFDVEPDCIIFTTKANGDQIRITNTNLSRENAANLASLIGGGKTLTVEITEKEE